MTTIGLRRLRGLDAGAALLAAGVAVWATVVIAVWLGLWHVPVAHGDALLRFGVPGALLAIALLRRSTTGPLPLAAGVTCGVTGATVLAGAVASNPKIAFALPGAAIGGILTQRRPALALGALFALTGVYGSLGAFTHVASDRIADYVLYGLWAGVIGGLLLGRKRPAIRATPALFLLLGFMIATILALVTTTPLAGGMRAFRLGPMYLSVLLLIAYGGWQQRTLDRLARAAVAICLVVAAYATVRWAIGPAASEEALQRNEFAKAYNRLPGTGELKVQGSFVNGNLLGLWMACTIPFVTAIALSWRGLFRVVALATLPLSLIALLGSGQRAALVATIAGVLTVVIVHLLSRGAPGPRVGVAIASVFVLIAGATVVFPAVIDNPSKRERYESILTPSKDVPFQERLRKWRLTLDDLKGHPFGFGLGAGNPQAVGHRFADNASQVIDNSFLMIGYDQGLVVMALFVIALFVVLIELMRHAIWTRGPGPSSITKAAAGTVVAIMVEFMGANYYAFRPVVAGWMIVGLGIAQLSVARAPAV